MIMKKILKVIVIVLFIGFVVLQFFGIDKTNPPINQAETLEATTQVPENLQAIFKRSCDDCHTNKSVYPWYANITPISWQVAHHIEDGRKHLNFSVWQTYEDKKKRRKLGEVCEEVENGAMPDNQYLWIHWDAILTAEDKKIICDWTKTEIAKLPE